MRAIWRQTDEQVIAQRAAELVAKKATKAAAEAIGATSEEQKQLAQQKLAADQNPAIAANKQRESDEKAKHVQEMEIALEQMEAQLRRERQAAADAMQAQMLAIHAREQAEREAEEAAKEADFKVRQAELVAETKSALIKKEAVEQVMRVRDAALAATAEAKAHKAAAAEAIELQRKKSAQQKQLEAEAKLAALRECPVCLETLASDDGIGVHALVPCGHSLCAICAPPMVGGPCPVCSNVVTSSLRVFV